MPMLLVLQMEFLLCTFLLSLLEKPILELWLLRDLWMVFLIRKLERGEKGRKNTGG